MAIFVAVGFFCPPFSFTDLILTYFDVCILVHFRKKVIKLKNAKITLKDIN